ncbi:MAG: hypothetical protein MJ190_00265 [Bacilli bacterium]|nr:hypothetical protein [Bacilli bacterium]
MVSSNKLRILVTGFLSLLSTFAIAVGTFAWFIVATPTVEKDQIVGGEVGLRSYFYDGNGTQENPYEIVSPIHFYNLTRLQNLGVFEKKTYFTVGHIFNESEGYQCIMPRENGESEFTKYLDMSSMNEVELPPIGGESAPFYGDFDGHNIPITNLEITGYPEDIGVFGYVASNASVENVIFKDLTVNSTGYDSRDSNVDQLFGSEVDDIFAAETERFAKDGGLKLSYDGASIELKNPNGLGATSYSHINSNDHINTIEEVDYSDFYFTEYHPNDTAFNYHWRFSTTLLEKREVNGEERAFVNFSRLKDYEEFNTEDVYVDTRLSLIASITVDGYVYSRVVQTYLCRIQSNGSTYDEGNYSMTLYCDFVAGDFTNYHHGTNVGYIAGHVDGSLNNCYLYNGTLNLNSSDLTSVKSESQTGLVGEIGTSVLNDISPDISLQLHGETGVMNFSKVYGVIRDNYEVNQTTTATYGYHESTKHSYIMYDDKIKDYEGLYSEYLRQDAAVPQHYITKISKDQTKTGSFTVTKDYYSEVNTVDFANNKVIADEDGKDRGLGVFKITTGHSDNVITPENIGEYYLDGIGTSKIINEMTPKTKVYYSTAEIDHTKFGVNYKWNTGDNQLDNIGAEPNWSSVNTFSPLYQRDFDYIYEMNIADIDNTHGNNFFYNTTSPFLTNYFSKTLIDKYGSSINPGTQRFGFMLRSSENEILSGLSSYMPVGVPKTKFAFTSGDQQLYYPSNAIVFKIENPNGANVSVIGNKDDISIYGFDSSTSASTFTKKYTMHSSETTYQYLYHNNSAGNDMCRYFRYDAATGKTDTKSVDRTVVNPETLTRSGRLFAHIFKLPQGEYCIGASNGTANVYFLAAQGQNDGTIGSSNRPLMDNSIANVDFVLNDPLVYSKQELQFSEVSMTIEFNIADGSFIANSDEGYLKLIFDETSNNFVDFLLILDKKILPYYVIDNAPHIQNATYQKKGNSYRGGA